MSTRPETLIEVMRWVEKAENDFRNAEYVLTMEENCPFDTVCYHCQQCAEKYMKAALVLHGINFPRTHDLVVLFNLLRQIVQLSLQVQEVQPLNRYSIESRYPGDWEPISEAEAKAGLEKAIKIRKVMRNILSSELMEEEKS